MKEEKPLRILLAEDLPADAELAEKEIRKSGIEFISRRVETKETFLKALEEFQPDVIVSDYRMPAFNGMEALRLSLQHDSTIPFIILTGSMNEETAVECMKAGAANYVIKEHIARLPFAVKEALEQKKMRMAKEEAERALHESESSLQGILQSTADGILAVSKENKVLYANERFAEMWMIPQGVMDSKDDSTLLHHVLDQLVDPQRFLQKVQELYTSKEISFDTLYFKDGRIFERLSRPLMEGAEWRGRVWSFRDITERKRAEKQITLLAHTVKSIIECVSITDMNDKLLFVNEAFLNTYGYEEREILGKDITIVRSPNNPPEVLRGIQEVTLGGGWHGELMNRTKDGREFPVLLSTSAVRDDMGQVVGLVGVATDITERKQVEEALKQEKALMDALMNNIPDSIYFKDRQCRLVRINRKMMQDLKLDDMSQIVGKTDVELFGEEFGRKTLDGDERLMAIGKPVVGLTESRQLENGQINWTLTSKVPLRDDSGEIVGLVGITREINELMKAHEEREHERNLLRTLIDNLPDNIFIKDTESRFVVGNTAVVRQLGFATEEELIGKTDFDLFPRELAAQFYAEEQRIIQSGQGIYDNEAHAVDANKEEKDGWVSTTKVPLRDAQGKIMGIVGIGRYTTERKRAEIALRTSEAQLSNAVKIARLGHWEYDVASDLFTFNDHFYAILRTTVEQEGGYTMSSARYAQRFVHPDDAPVVGIEIRKSLEATDPHHSAQLEHRIIYADGETGYISVRIFIVKDDQGRTIKTYGANQDITERKRAEEELRKNEEKYRSIFDNVAEGIFQSTPDGKFLTVNPAMARILGFSSPEELIRERTDIARQSYVHPEQREEFKRLMEQQNKVSGFEYEVPRKDGSTAWVSETAQAVRDATGRIVRYDGVFIDITVRKEAEKALKKSEEEYRQFFEEDLTGDYVSTPEGKILSCNPAFARIYGFASVEDALKADTHTLYVEPEDREIFLRLLKERKKLEYYESEYLRRDGAHVYCVENAVGVFDKQDNLVQFWGYIFDDTKRKTLERQLIQAQKLESLGTLASGIAHDFNNILGIILGYATLLTRQEPDPENIKNSADAVIRASQRGAALVKQLLTFARKVDVQLQSVRLNDIVNELSILLSETFAKTVEISLHLEEDLPTITGDPTQIHQVLLNLCVNARDSMPKGGTIGITTSCQQGETIRAKFPRAVAHKYVVLKVADTGIGMDKRTLSRIFEPFFTTKGVGKGTGLGLSVVFGIVESHDGFVDVESEPGKGTTFHLYFPVLQTVDIGQAKAEVQQVIPGGKETILVVEDEEMLTRLLRTSLQTAGYTVLVAVDGQEAVDLFNQHQNEIQLVLSDVGLPKLTGYDVFRKMKRTKPNLKFILASGFIEPQLKSEIFKEGVRDFVQKPYSIYEVLKAIRTILDQK